MYNPQLETFLRVADAGSFNKAAEELFITPPAVMKQITSLEASLDIQLFRRSHRGLTLTEAGNLFTRMQNTSSNTARNQRFGPETPDRRTASLSASAFHL